MNNNSNLFTNNIFNLMDKRANLYFAALLGAEFYGYICQFQAHLYYPNFFLTSSLKKYVFYN